MHAPFVHVWPLAQTTPHPPQLFALVLMLVSQPFAALPSQLPDPALHAATPHAPAEHAAVPLAAEHTVPHAPQLLTLLATLVSHPSAPLLLQSLNPALHAATTHAPLAQAGVPF